MTGQIVGIVIGLLILCGLFGCYKWITWQAKRQAELEIKGRIETPNPQDDQDTFKHRFDDFCEALRVWYRNNFEQTKEAP